MTMINVKVYMLAFSILLLSACGFHLRGTANLPEALLHMYVTPGEVPRATVDVVENALTAASVKLSSTAEFELRLIKEEQTRRTLSVNSNAKSSAFELRSDLHYSLYHNDYLILGPILVSTRKSYENDNTNIIGKREEEQLQRLEMRQDLVRKLMYRLQALQPQVLKQLCEDAKQQSELIDVTKDQVIPE
jgi:LPS-assembly lipoprotein